MIGSATVRPSHITATLLCAALVACALASCGGSADKSETSRQSTTAAREVSTPGGGSLPSGAVARVGTHLITEAELDHATQVVAGNLFVHFTKRQAPRGLASYPADNAACNTELAKAVADISNGKTSPPSSELREWCQHLNADFQREGLSRLITQLTLAGLAGEAHVAVSNGEVRRHLQHVEAASFPKTGSFQRYLAMRNWSLADELAELKQELLSNKLQATLMAKDDEAQIVKFAEEGAKRWTARTTCRSDLAVAECAGYSAHGEHEATSAAVILERIAALQNSKT